MLSSLHVVPLLISFFEFTPPFVLWEYSLAVEFSLFIVLSLTENEKNCVIYNQTKRLEKKLEKQERKREKQQTRSA